MKKRILFSILFLLLFLPACSNSTEQAESETVYQESSEPDIAEDGEKYFVTFECKQSHFSLDIGQHLKDAMNVTEFEVMVDSDYYNSVDVGTVINDEFRVGSFVMKGSIGNWEITVTEKEIR